MQNEILTKYLLLQECDTAISLVDKKLSHISSVVRLSEQKLSDFKEELKSLTTNKEKIVKELRKVEVDYDRYNLMLTSSKHKLSLVRNDKQYTLASKEIESISSKVELLKNQVEELRDHLAKEQEKINLLQNLIEKQNEEIKNSLIATGEEEKKLANDLATIESKRLSVVSSLSKPTLSKYEKIRLVRNNLAVVELNGNACGGCFLTLPLQMVVNVKKGMDLIQCPHCNRFLYFKKEEAEGAGEEK